MNVIPPQTTRTDLCAPADLSGISYRRVFPICLTLLVVAHALAFPVNDGKPARASGRDALTQRSILLQQGSRRLVPGKIQLQPCSQPMSGAETTIDSAALSQISVIDTAITWTTRDTLRHLYAFDDKARRTADRVQKLVGDQWVDTMLQTNTYDAHGNMLTNTYEGLTPGCGAHRGMRVLYTYDANDCLIEAVRQSQDTVEWKTTVRDVYTYDGDRNMLTGLYQAFNQATGQWHDLSRETYTYDVNGTKRSWLSEYVNNDGVWDGVTRFTYFYEAQGREITRLEEQGYQNEWWAQRRESFTYGASGDLLFDTFTSWRDSCWQDAYRYTYVYNGDHRILAEGVEWWQGTGWFAEERRTYSYDGAGRQTGWLYETRTDSLWVNGTRWDLAYDAEGRISSWASAYWDTSGWEEGRAGLFSVADSAGNEYVFHGAVWVTLRYKNIESGINTAGREVPGEYALLQNYPNPFNPSTRIKYTVGGAGGLGLGTSNTGARGSGLGTSNTKIVVYDLLGREVAVLVDEKKAPGSYEVTFDGSSLASGVYFYRLTAVDFVSTRKLVVLR